MNSTNNPQKSKFQDKGGEESDKVEKNILDALAGNRTIVVIRDKRKPRRPRSNCFLLKRNRFLVQQTEILERIKAIKWRGKVKEGGFEKREEKRSIKKKN